MCRWTGAGVEVGATRQCGAVEDGFWSSAGGCGGRCGCLCGGLCGLRHAGGCVVFCGFWGCWFGSGLRCGWCWCKLFPCCRSARVFPRGGGSGWPSGGGLRTQERVVLLFCESMIASPIPASFGEWPRGLDGGRGFVWIVFLINGPVNGFGAFGFSTSCFFVEGSILAQDERWRRA